MRKILALIITILFLSTISDAAIIKYQDTVQTKSGQAIPGAVVEVADYVTGLTPTLYTSDTGSTQKTSVTTDSNGTYWFYVNEGRYDITISKTGHTTQSNSDVIITGVLLDLPHTWTGIQTFMSGLETSGTLTIGGASINVSGTVTAGETVSNDNLVCGMPYYDIRCAATITATDALATAAGKGLVCASTYTIPSAVTITSPIRAEKGCSLTKSGSGTLAINGPFDAGLYQVFSGFSAGDVTGLKEASPRWFGAVADGVANDAGPFNQACSSVRAQGGIVEIAAGDTLRITSQVVATGIGIRGAGFASSKIFVNFSGSAGIYFGPTASARLEGCGIIGRLAGMDWTVPPTAGTIGVEVDASHNHLIRNNHFHTLNYGLWIEGGGYKGDTVSNLFQNNTVQLRLVSVDGSGPPNQQVIMNNQFVGGTVPIPYGVAIQLEGTATNAVDGTTIVNNDIENHTNALNFKLTKYTRLSFNRYEANSNKIQYNSGSGSAAVDSINPLEISGGGNYPSVSIGVIDPQQYTPEALTVNNGNLNVGHGVQGGGVGFGHINSTNEVGALYDADYLNAGLPSQYLALRFAGAGGHGLLFLNETTETARMEKNGDFRARSLAQTGLMTAPSTTLDTGTQGQIRFDANYIYFCTGANSWKRASLSTW